MHVCEKNHYFLPLFSPQTVSALYYNAVVSVSVADKSLPALAQTLPSVYVYVLLYRPTVCILVNCNGQLVSTLLAVCVLVILCVSVHYLVFTSSYALVWF